MVMGSELGGDSLSPEGEGRVLQHFATSRDNRDDILDYNAPGTHPLLSF